jgi:hypothetical protein
MTVMAMRALDAPADVDVELLNLSGRWPVGARVRHESGWTGTVAPTAPPDFPVLGHTAAHAVLGWQGSRSISAVAVTWIVDGYPAVAWYRPRVLRRLGRAAR